MTTYYWEKPIGCKPGHGEFSAYNDTEALEKRPGECILLYREHSTPDGLPFIIIFDASKYKG